MEDDVEYIPLEETVELFQTYSKIYNIQQIITLAKEIRRKGLSQHPYKCIEKFMFLVPRSKKHPSYKYLVENKRTKPWKVLDIGCCMGTDVRQFMVDGIVNFQRGDSVVGVDVNASFFKLGYQLFGDEDKLKHVFRMCNFLSIVNYKWLEKYDVVYCGSVIHLFNQVQAEILVKNMFKVMNEGAIVFGRTLGSENAYSVEIGGAERYLHSSQTLKELLVGVGFIKVEVVVEEDWSTFFEPSQVTNKRFYCFTACKR